MSGTGASTPWRTADAADARDRNTCTNGLRRELDRARRHVARLEAEMLAAEQAREQSNAYRVDAPPESPIMARLCNATIAAIMVFPMVWLVVKFLERILG